MTPEEQTTIKGEITIDLTTGTWSVGGEKGEYVYSFLRKILAEAKEEGRQAAINKLSDAFLNIFEQDTE